MSDKSRTVYTSFSRTASYVLYGHALKECFTNMVWTGQGMLVGVAVTVTIVRHFLAHVVFNDYCELKWNKVNQFLGLWMCILLSGLAAMAARWQGDNRLVYVIPVMAVVDLLWAGRVYKVVRNGDACSWKMAIRCRMAINVVMVAFFLSIFMIRHQLLAVMEDLGPETAWLAVTGLLMSAVVDLLLNSRFYWLE